MSEQDTFRGPTPAKPVILGALPSRAAGDAPQQPVPMFEDTPATPARKRSSPRKPTAKKKPAAKKTQAVSRKEAAALAAKRAKALAAKKRKPSRSIKSSPSVIKAAQRTVLPVAPPAPKNPNRPLEMKNQLQAVIAMTGVLKKPELELFAKMVAALQSTPRNSRKKIIDGLQSVYS